MKNFKELIDWAKDVRANTDSSESNCDVINLKDGKIEVFKLSHQVTMNITLHSGGEKFLMQIIYKGTNVAGCIYDRDGKQTSSCGFNIDDDICNLKRLVHNSQLSDLLVKNIENLH